MQQNPAKLNEIFAVIFDSIGSTFIKKLLKSKSNEIEYNKLGITILTSLSQSESVLLQYSLFIDCIFDILHIPKISLEIVLESLKLLISYHTISKRKVYIFYL